MQPIKKSRKFSIFAAIFILLAGIVIGGYLVLKSKSGGAVQLKDVLAGNSVALKNCTPDANDANKDSDNDGLKDWQEMQIYQTDPCKPDTDGDGYLDGEEVTSGYDPAKKAPGDELPGTAPKTPRPLPQNLTEALRQALKQQIADNKISAFSAQGQLLSAEEIQNYPALQATIQDAIANTGELFAPDKIDDNQIKTALSNDQAAIQNYAADAATALSYQSNPEIQTSESETEMFLNVLEKNDFSELEMRLQNYQAAYEKLKKLTVPSDLLPLHKEQLEIISSLIKIYQAIKEINSDPLKANLALQAYEPLSEKFTNWLQKLVEFINSRP